MKLLNVNNIKFNDYPDVKDITQPYVVLDDFDDPIPELHYDGDRVAYNYIVQIDVLLKQMINTMQDYEEMKYHNVSVTCSGKN